MPFLWYEFFWFRHFISRQPNKILNGKLYSYIHISKLLPSFISYVWENLDFLRESFITLTNYLYRRDWYWMLRNDGNWFRYFFEDGTISHLKKAKTKCSTNKDLKILTIFHVDDCCGRMNSSLDCVVRCLSFVYSTVGVQVQCDLIL